MPWSSLETTSSAILFWADTEMRSRSEICSIRPMLMLSAAGHFRSPFRARNIAQPGFLLWRGFPQFLPFSELTPVLIEKVHSNAFEGLLITFSVGRCCKLVHAGYDAGKAHRTFHWIRRCTGFSTNPRKNVRAVEYADVAFDQDANHGGPTGFSPRRPPSGKCRLAGPHRLLAARAGSQQLLCCRRNRCRLPCLSGAGTIPMKLSLLHRPATSASASPYRLVDHQEHEIAWA